MRHRRRGGRLFVLGLLLELWGCGSEPTPVAPPSPPGPPPNAPLAVRFLGSTPFPGSTIAAVECEDGLFCAEALEVRLEVSASLAVARPSLEVELLDTAGAVCATGYWNDAPPELAPESRLIAAVRRFDVGEQGCPFPHSAASVTTLRLRATLRGGGLMARNEVDASYTFVGPPLSPVPTAPEITALCWDAPGPSGGWCGDGPLPGDRASYQCVVRDPDGDALTVTLSFEATEGCPTSDHCWSETRSFPARFVPGPVEITTSHGFPETTGALLSCRAVDSRGREARDSFCFGRC